MDVPATSEWFWEGNLVTRIVEYLERHGWTVVSVAGARDREHGPDIDARRGGRGVVIEVKGYPSDRYRDPRRAAERKRTNPRLQADHWFAQAFLKVVKLADHAPFWETAIGLPDIDTYRRLVDACEPSLRALGIGIYLVSEDGAVSQAIPHRPRGEALAALSAPTPGTRSG